MNGLTKICLTLLVSGAAVGHAHAHAFVDHAEPVVGGKVKQIPHVVRIWFTEPIQPALSTIKVFDATQKQIDEKDTHSDARNKALLQVSLPSLGPGTYKVIWRVTSVDGHVTNGDFAFRVAP
jgi:methionine-rich copper-binding protein CopC